MQTHSSRLVARMLTACSGVFWMFNPLMVEWLMLWSERTLESLLVQVRLMKLQRFRDILGLLLAAVATLTIPPAGTVALNDVTGRPLDSNSLALKLDEESLKLLIVKSSRSSKSDLKVLCQYRISGFSMLWCCQQELGPLLTCAPALRFSRSILAPAGTWIP